MTEIRQLVQQCLQGDQVAMRDLVNRYRGQVFGLCYRMLGHRQDAEDVTQETFVRVLRSLGGWDAEREFEPWLLAIAGNRCRTALARRMKRPTAQELPEVPDVSPCDVQAARNLAEELQRALARIRVEYREAFVLFHEQELAYNDIAEVMGCPVGTVKTWVHRARREIVEHLRQREVLGSAVSQEREHAMRKL